MQTRLAFLTGVSVLLGASLPFEAIAQDPIRIAQVEEAPEEESGAAAPEAPPPDAPARAPSRPGIEEIVIQGGESDAVADFEAADSVTGFDASDLEALGAQTVEGLGKYTPNLEIVTAGATTPTFFIRGVGLNDFNANTTSSVAIYQDDVPINAPALQLGTLFDTEQVNVLRGPQGYGLNRNASAGAIKIYSRRPSGEYGANFSSSFGNYGYKDFQGAVEAPVYEDVLSSRLAFRWSERDGYATNNCAGATPIAERMPFPNFQNAYFQNTLILPRAVPAGNERDPRWSVCGENVVRTQVTPGAPFGFPGTHQWIDPLNGRPDLTPQIPPPSYTNTIPTVNAQGFRVSPVPDNLPERVNNLGNWAARGTLLFQPTLDMDWTLNFHGSRRDELSRLGQAYGTTGTQFYPDGTTVQGLLGGTDIELYRVPEVLAMREKISARIVAEDGVSQTEANRAADLIIMKKLRKSLDNAPHRGNWNLVGPTKNDTWGYALKGEVALPNGMDFTTVTAYDNYDRLTHVDLDQTPNTLFEILTDDEGWQTTQDLKLSGEISETIPLRWEVGGYYLFEVLDVEIDNDFGQRQDFGVAKRDYTQKLWSTGGYASFEWDFWDAFTLDGGVRYNWEEKFIDYVLERSPTVFTQKLDNTWQAPTGGIRLTYRFREDTHAYWKYSRGWKGGHYNATSSDVEQITIAEPESIDAFEAGTRGSWYDGRLNLDFSLFYYAYENYQIFTAQQTSDGQPEFVVLNANDAEVYGAEVDLTGRPLPGMFVGVRFSWLESAFLDFVQIQQRRQQLGAGDSTLITKELQNSGNPLLNSPRFKVSLTAEQTVGLGRLGSLTARWDGVWTDTTYYDATAGAGIPNNNNQQFYPDDTFAQRPFWLHNLRLGYRPPGSSIEIAGWVRNLEDKVYKSFAFDGSTFNNTTVFLVGEPRTFGLSFSTDF